MNDIPLNKYASILKQPYTKSRLHPRMPDSMRAVQFSPFAALSGHEEAIKKVCQYLEERQGPTEDEREILQYQLEKLQLLIHQKPLITISFIENGKPLNTQQLTANVKKLDEYNKLLIMNDGRKIPLECILSLDF